jgi:Alpha-L-arabinofuranosidase B, catalytic
MAGSLVGLRATNSQTVKQRPCDIYAAESTPCVAAHSTVRSLYAKIYRRTISGEESFRRRHPKHRRHYYGKVYIASDGNGANPWDTTSLWSDDTSFIVSPPWSAIGRGSRTNSKKRACDASTRRVRRSSKFKLRDAIIRRCAVYPSRCCCLLS